MIIRRYRAEALGDSFGIQMGGIDGLGTAAAWGRVPPGGKTEVHRHDESEQITIISGDGEFLVDDRRIPAGPGTVAVFAPFEPHVLGNVGDGELVFLTQYWRDAAEVNDAVRGEGRVDQARPIFVFSTPPTPNGDLHLGHLSGPYLGADAYVRYQRMNGARAWHLTGSDDFQSYVRDLARREQRAPDEIAAHFSAEIAATLALMDIEPDQYTITGTDPDYRRGLREFFSKLVASGRIEPVAGPALADPENGAYLYEVDVAGGCPVCASATRGNICEECGEPNAVVDLLGPISVASGLLPVPSTVTRFMLPLHAFREAVLLHHRFGRVPARLRQLADRVFRRERLDIAVTHPSDWGVSPSESEGAGQVVWVWPEMSYGFLHGIGRLAERLGEDWKANAPQPEWKLVHFFGYDNSFYHCILFPALYSLAFPAWQPEIDYHVNEFYLLEGKKFSTSRRHAIWGKEILSPDSADAVRYFLAATRAERTRTNFTTADYERVLHEQLIGIWQRWLVDLGCRVTQLFGGRAPEAGNWTAEHLAFLRRLYLRLDATTASLEPDGFSLRAAAAEIDGLVGDAVRFAAEGDRLGGIGTLDSEVRTSIVLELTAAKLLAAVSAPIMPRFAATVDAALGGRGLRDWPNTIEPVPAGTSIALSDAVFFRPSLDAAAVPVADAVSS
ncbi:class I tRNA ligase family protein [Nocardia uniformis]|uniref:Class I tRNA ligase family protein n=1 Tax=Nocardia uniformis TaxID=53432 RepID=A0A849BVN7_9NOCA|nr:class I tRNA ligase family protein [Nocardia uniformis]NNH68370.1 class I tRNA ligase family protein [Nocardia uniformis]